MLAADGANRKALYRRGQALCALGRYAPAVDDLRRAVQLSPDSEKDVIREKLAEAKQKLRQESAVSGGARRSGGSERAGRAGLFALAKTRQPAARAADAQASLPSLHASVPCRAW